MSSQVALTLNTVVYAAKGLVGRVASWINRGSGLPGAFSNASMQLSDPISPKGTTYLVTATLDVPIVATVDSECSCAGQVLRTSVAKVTVQLPNTGTTAERTDVLLRLRGLIADAQFTELVTNLNLPTS